MPVIAMLTIGQTPREDIADDLRQLLPAGWELRQYGALDGLTRAEAEQLCGYESRGELLVTRMAGDSRQIALSADRIFVRLQDCITRAEREGADLHLMACTGNFPPYIHNKQRFRIFLKVLPQTILYKNVSHVFFSEVPAF